MILDRRKLEHPPGDSAGSKLGLPASESAPADDIPSLSETAAATSGVDGQAVEIEFWDSIKNTVRAQEYEAYLERYPEGSFVALARARLDAIADDAASMRDPRDREIELAFWESVRESSNPAVIQAYLEKYPRGEFGTLAEIRLRELTPEGGPAA
jgi:adenylate cyclase